MTTERPTRDPRELDETGPESGGRFDAAPPVVSDQQRVRVRDLGVTLGRYAPGRFNAITDVEGVRVGHATIIRGEGRLKVGAGPVRTGVTAILPNGRQTFKEQIVGGGFILNGAGEVSGLTQVMEWGLIETPILLTNTLSVGTCSEAVVKYMVKKHPGIGLEHDVVIPLVGECDDSWLNDVAGRHVREDHVFEAIRKAGSGPVTEGNVGAGTGMITCDFSGGIGTSSRKLPGGEGGYTLGVLVLSNFGRLIDLRMDGVPVGEILAPMYSGMLRREKIFGSIIAVVGTDAPLLNHQLNRLAKRVALGIGRAGSYAAHGSGEIIIAFSTANSLPRASRKRVFKLDVLSDHHMDPLYEATIEATEEAILNALCMAVPMTGLNRRIAPALPLQEVREILERYHVPKLQGKLPPPLRRVFIAPWQQIGFPQPPLPKPPKKGASIRRPKHPPKRRTGPKHPA